MQNKLDCLSLISFYKLDRKFLVILKVTQIEYLKVTNHMLMQQNLFVTNDAVVK